MAISDLGMGDFWSTLMGGSLGNQASAFSADLQRQQQQMLNQMQSVATSSTGPYNDHYYNAWENSTVTTTPYIHCTTPTISPYLVYTDTSEGACGDDVEDMDDMDWLDARVEHVCFLGKRVLA